MSVNQIPEYKGHRVRRVDTDGIITTVAGTGQQGYDRDGKPATLAGLDGPNGVFVDRNGDLYIAEENNHRILKVINPYQAVVSFRQTPISFGRVDLGATVDTPFTITNTGLDTLYIDRITVTPAVFSLQDKAVTILPGKSMTDRLRFSPTRGGPVYGVLEVISNGYASPDTLFLFGRGLPPLTTLPSDTSTATFESADDSRVRIRFSAGPMSGHTLRFEHFGRERPDAAQRVPGFSRPLFYCILETSLPDTTTFSADITIEYTQAQLDSAGVTDENSLTMAVFDTMTLVWTPVQTTLDTAANTATFSTEHFSIWALASVDPTGIEDRGAASPASQAVRPTVFSLHQNYPNPFNPSTTIAYDVPRQSHITLTVYNLLGQEVIRLVDAVQTPGRYTMTWNGRNAQGRSVASGIYVYRVTGTGFSQTKRMALLK